MCSFFLNKIDIKNTNDVLEIGCGSGAFSKQIKAYKPISGIDYSTDAVKNNLDIELISEDVPELSFYESASYRFFILLRRLN